MTQTEQKTEIEKKLEHFEARIPLILLGVVLVFIIVTFIVAGIGLAISFPISTILSISKDKDINQVIFFGIGIVFFILFFVVLVGALGYFVVGGKTEKITINSRRSFIIAVVVISVLILFTVLGIAISFFTLLFGLTLILILLIVIMTGALGRVLGRAMGGILGGVIGGLLGGLIGSVMSNVLGILIGDGSDYLLYMLLPIGLELLGFLNLGLYLIRLRIIRFGTSGIIGRNTEQQEQLGARLGACFAMMSFFIYIVYLLIIFNSSPVYLV